MQEEDEITAAKRRLIEELITESLTSPYVHEECGDTMWDDTLAEHAAKKEEE